jgi:hypothetical protein
VLSGWLRAAGRRLLASPPADTMTRIMRSDARADTFVRAIDFVNFERVPGDVVECGVYGGLSLAILGKAATFDPKGMTRRIVGFDTFEGLPPSEEVHARWQPGDCARTAAWHPLAEPGERITAALTRRLFLECGLDTPILHEGPFDRAMPSAIPSAIPAIAVLHVDCDLYESARDVLESAAPALQDGSVLLFDDWFHYRAHRGRGESRAFDEFLGRHPEWDARHWTTYGTFSTAFILSRR